MIGSRDECCDVVVVGGGPAGATAALYLARIGRRVVLFGGDPGASLIAGVREIDNFPGVPRLDGAAWLAGLQAQCREAGVGWVDGDATVVNRENRRYLVARPARRASVGVGGAGGTGSAGVGGSAAGGAPALASGPAHSARAVIVATGCAPRVPAVPGIRDFWGRGVSTCAWCDGAWFRDRRVAVLGGGNAAFVAAGILARLAAEVHLLLPKRGDTAFGALRRQASAERRIVSHHEASLEAVTGDDRVRELHLRVGGDPVALPVDGLFLALGQTPRTDLLAGLVDRDPVGFVPADGHGRTHLPGLLVAGDIVAGAFRQLVIACGSGAAAALAAEQYLSRQWDAGG